MSRYTIRYHGRDIWSDPTAYTSRPATAHSHREFVTKPSRAARLAGLIGCAAGSWCLVWMVGRLVWSAL